MKNVIPMPHISPDLVSLIYRMKKVKAEMKPGSEPFIRMNQLIQETLRRGY